MGTGTGNLIGEGTGDNNTISLPVPETSDNNTSTGKNSEERDKLENLKEQVDGYLNENNLNSNVNTIIEDRGLIIRVDNTIIFDSGNADIKAIYKSKLIQVGKMLNSIENYIRIEGHTDNVPIRNSHFESNWQLSVIRATNVTEMLITEANINPKRLSAVGYGEYRPIADNDNPDSRAKNRRVDIIIMDTKFNKIEGN
jgi:chemotaxis protein MotB